MPRLRRSNEAEQARPGGKVEGTSFRLLQGIYDGVSLRKAERGKRQGAGLKPGPYKARRAELAGGEIFQGAKTAVEFGGRAAPICSGRRISTRWPVLLRSSKRKAPSPSSRRTAWRTGPLDRPRSRATDKTAKCRRSLPTTREWRRR